MSQLDVIWTHVVTTTSICLVLNTEPTPSSQSVCMYLRVHALAMKRLGSKAITAGPIPVVNGGMDWLALQEKATPGPIKAPNSGRV